MKKSQEGGNNHRVEMQDSSRKVLVQWKCVREFGSVLGWIRGKVRERKNKRNESSKRGNRETVTESSGGGGVRLELGKFRDDDMERREGTGQFNDL